MRNLKNELLDFVTKACSFERTLEVNSINGDTGLRFFTNYSLLEILEVVSVEFDDMGFELEVRAAFSSGVVGSRYLGCHSAFVYYDEYEDFEVFKSNTEEQAACIRKNNDKRVEQMQERLRLKELAELKRLQEKYGCQK